MSSIVQQNLQKKGIIASPQKQPGTFQSIVQSVASPFLKVASSVQGLVGGVGELGAAGLSALTGDQQGAARHVGQANEELTKKRDYGYLGSTRPVGINQDTGQGLNGLDWAKDVVGTGAEVGSYAAPVAGITRGASLGSRVAGGMIGGAAAGALSGAGQELQKPGTTAASIAKSAIQGGLAGATVGGAFPIASAGLRVIGKGAGKVGSEVLGRSTGAGEAAIREAYSNPNVVKFARQAGKEGPENLMTQALEDAQKGLKTLRQNRSSEYVSQLNKIKTNKAQLDSLIQDTRSVARQLAEDMGITTKEGKLLLNSLNFENSTIERGQGTVQKAFNDVMRWTDNTPAGLDKLKKKLDQHLDEIPATERGGAFNFVLQLKNSLSDGLKTNVTGYEQMVSRYSEAENLIKEIQRALSLKDNLAKDTAVRKLMSSMRQNNELRKELIEVLGLAGGKDISGKIAGATLAARTPRGLAGTFQPTAIGIGGVTGIINASHIPFLLLYLATTSPRLMAEAVSLLGKVKGGVIPPNVQTVLRNLLIRASTEETQDA